MMVCMIQTLETFADWIRATDHHASHHLRLLEQAQQMLAGGVGDARTKEGVQRRVELATQLERWRYQHLKRRPRDLSRQDRELVEALDLAANALAGRPGREPRHTWQVIAGTTPIDCLAAVDYCLQREVALDRVCREAADATEEYFTLAPSDNSDARQRRMLLYAPLYLSNHCTNHCVYCGFRYPQATERKHLDFEEAQRQIDVLHGRGLRHVLLVAGDFPHLTTTGYFARITRYMVDRGIQPAIEIAPQDTASYATLAEAGVRGVTLYQETYHEELYSLYHPRGSKALFDWRLEGLDRAAEAGMQRLGLGILLGLADPRADLLALTRHGDYLRQRFPDRTLAFSLPRIHQAPPDFQTPYPVDDETFIRMYCALRWAFPQAELVLSTRESPSLRDRLAGICITQMSAGSCTAPGGYAEESASAAPGEQFPVCDDRSVAEMARRLETAGIAARWEIT